MKILIIESNLSILQQLVMLFEEEGHYILTATDTPEALKLLYKEQPDLIVSDNKLSCINGIQLRNLIKLQFMKHIPILLFKTLRSKRKFLGQPALIPINGRISRFD